MSKYQFGWGDTYGIREAILKVAPWLSRKSLPVDSFGYPRHEGQIELIALVSKLLKKLTGRSYQYILITEGCTHALSAYVYAKKTNLRIYDQTLATRKLYFPFYPGIAEIHGLTHSPGDIGTLKDAVQILDSPSNPEGIITGDDLSQHSPLVWDAAYHSPTYGVRIKGTREFCTAIPPHEAMAGSMSKLTGINGIRLGWLATNDPKIYEKASAFVTYDICGASFPSQWLAKEILQNVDMEEFWTVSKNVLDNNRTELQKLSHLFGEQEIPSTGMFALFEVDNKLKKLLDKTDVITTPGYVCGDDRDSIRINLAHTNSITRSMVKAVLKNDKSR